MLFTAISNHKSKTGVISTKKMMNFIKSKNKIFDGKYHQDSHEFYMWFINECDELLKDK
jgi:ubiquitin carboxyl-terminal hydrolase 12/46